MSVIWLLGKLPDPCGSSLAIFARLFTSVASSMLVSSLKTYNMLLLLISMVFRIVNNIYAVAVSNMSVDLTLYACD